MPQNWNKNYLVTSRNFEDFLRQIRNRTQQEEFEQKTKALEQQIADVLKWIQDLEDAHKEAVDKSLEYHTRLHALIEERQQDLLEQQYQVYDEFFADLEPQHVCRSAFHPDRHGPA